MLTVTTPPAAGGPAMPPSDFILIVFCLVDDLVRQLAPRRLRGRGFAPAPPLGPPRGPSPPNCWAISRPCPPTRRCPPPPPATTPPSSPACGKSTAPPSPARPPTSTP